MRFHLTSGTDIAAHVLYDPSAWTGRNPADLDRSGLERELAEGLLLQIVTHADGEEAYTVFVDEPLPDDLRSRVEKETRDLLLRAPGGRLVASGREYLARPTTETDASVLLAPGDYLVDAYETDFDWDEDMEPVLLREIGPGYRREKRVGFLGSLLFLGGLVTIAVGLGAGKLWMALAGLVSALVGAAVFALFLPGADYRRRKKEIIARFPTLVLVLRRLPEGADRGQYRGKTIDIG